MVAVEFSFPSTSHLHTDCLHEISCCPCRASGDSFFINTFYFATLGCKIGGKLTRGGWPKVKLNFAFCYCLNRPETPTPRPSPNPPRAWYSNQFDILQKINKIWECELWNGDIGEVKTEEHTYVVSVRILNYLNCVWRHFCKLPCWVNCFVTWKTFTFCP